MDIGSAVGRKEGLTERQLMELADFEHSDAFNDLEKTVLRFATHLTLTPAEVPDEVAAVMVTPGCRASSRSSSWPV